MIEKQPLPDWAPDDCPPNVVKLIDDEQYLQDLRLRGLSSADSAELHQAVRHLKSQLGAAFDAGRQAARQLPAMSYAAGYLVVGYVAGALCGFLLAVYLLT